MPLLLTDDKDVVKVDLPAEGEWVKVKRALSRADERAVQKRIQSATRAEVDHAGRFTGIAHVDAGELMDVARFATLELAIVEWSFSEPITPRNIRALDDASLDVIQARLNELYPGPRSEDEQKNS